MRRALSAFTLAGVILVSGCGEAGGSLVTWETIEGGQFVTEIADPGLLDRLEEALAGDGRAGIPNGKLMPGDGGVNPGHEWHMVDVELVEVAIEVCDGTVAMVDADVDYWLNVVGNFCPWHARVVAIDRGGV